MGISEGIYIQFPNISKVFYIRPLVMRNLSCHLNLGARFNFRTGLILQTTRKDAEGKKVNFSELDGMQI